MALNEHNRLYIPDVYNADSDVGNIYVLLYLKTERNNYCGSYHEIDQDELKKYKKLAKEVNTSLSSSTNSIHPCTIRKKTWQESKEILSNFCNYLTNMEDDYLGEIGKLRKTSESEPIHIEKCKELIWAMDILYNATR